MKRWPGSAGLGQKLASEMDILRLDLFYEPLLQI